MKRLLAMAVLLAGITMPPATGAAASDVSSASGASHCGIAQGDGAERRIRVWTNDPHWAPPACAGWSGTGFRVLVDISGPVAVDGGAVDLLSRLGAISGLRGLRYWSISEEGWEVLVEDASALSSPVPEARRADFTPAELQAGSVHFFTQTDNRTRNPTIYRLEVLERGEDRIVATVENVTAMSKLMLTLAEPGALQSLHILARGADGRWSYRLLSRTGLGVPSLAAGRAESMANRAAALFSHLAGLQPPDGSALH